MAGAWIDGKPVALAAAAVQAAKLLAASRLPVIAGLGTDIAGARAAITLAERVGGVVDHMHSEALMRDLGVMRESGIMVTTANEARVRGDLILLFGPGLSSAWPELAERLLDQPLASELGGGRRRVVWLCSGSDGLKSPLRSSPRKRGTSEQDSAGSAPSRGGAEDAFGGIQIIGRDSANLPTVLAGLRARVNDRPANKTAVQAKVLDALAADLKTAKFGVAVWSSASIGEPAIEMLCGLVRDLNAATRFSGLPLTPGDNASGVAQACGWMTGFPPRTGFGRGFPEHDPWRFESRRLIESGEADVLLYISAYGRAVSPVYDPGLTMIALCGPDTSGRDDAQVRIEVGRPAVDHNAVAYCADTGTLVYRKAANQSDALSVAEAIALIAAELPPRPRPC